MLTRWKLTIEYDGTGFLGWQRQKEGRTVQQELEVALATFCRQKVAVAGQGRTDRGVHAEAQVAHADLPSHIGRDRLLPAMRGLLPSDMAVIRAEMVPQDFHARFDATSRRYRYQISTRSAPLKRDRFWVVHAPLDGDMLYHCSEMVSGSHDFRNFAKETAASEKNTRCLIHHSQWSRQEDTWHYQIEGNRFLRHMVRRLAGTMIRVAEDRISITAFRNLLDGEITDHKGHSAPPHGLFLEAVMYGAFSVSEGSS